MRFALVAVGMAVAAVSPANAITTINGTTSNGVIDYQDDGSLFQTGKTRVTLVTSGIIQSSLIGLTTEYLGDTFNDTCDFGGYCTANGSPPSAFIADFWSANSPTSTLSYTVTKLAGGVASNHFIHVLPQLTDHSMTYTLTFAENAVPEPASWAMMIAGFGLTGGVMRRRRLPALKSA
jgi:hypothetical protein